MSKPPKPPVAMTDEEIDIWADEIFLGMTTTYERICGESRSEKSQGDR